MSLTIATRVYTADAARTPDSIPYWGPANTASWKDILVVSRTAAKPTKTYSGNTRGSFKFQRQHTLTGALTTTGISTTELAWSHPVGIAAADQDTLAADFVSLCGLTPFKDSMKKGLIVN